MRFIERAGLVQWYPDRRSSPIETLHDKLPGTDRSTHWANAAAGQVIVVDEPCDRALDEKVHAA